MKSRRRAGTNGERGLPTLAGFGAVVLASCIAQGCAVEQAETAPDPIAESQPTATERPSTEIRNGRPVNYRPEPLSAKFPLSTVYLETADTSPPSQCTGVILSATKILTAAHCRPDKSTVIKLYGVTGATPVGDPIGCNICVPGQIRVAAVDMPDGVTGVGGFLTIFTGSDLKDKNGNWADLAMVTLSAPIPTTYPWVAAKVAAPDFSAVLRRASWAVGTGDENDGDNPTDTMQYVAGAISSADDSPGYFQTTGQLIDNGDSGGPFFQLSPSPPEGGLGDLILVGILTGQQSPFYSIGQDRYTSVAFPSNNAWILQMLAAPPPSSQPDPVRPPSDDPQLLPGESTPTVGAEILPFPELQVGTRASR